MTKNFWLPYAAILAALFAVSCNSSDAPGSSGGGGGGSSQQGPGVGNAPPAAISNGADLSAAWANDGGDKVTRDELRVKNGGAASVNNRLWNGTKISVFGAKNEVVNFNLVLEASTTPASNVSVTFDTLTGPGGATITSAPATGNGVFDWTNRNIELFYVRYLQIKGLSQLSYGTYDERHIPKRFRRPFTGAGNGAGAWTDRPDHDKYYPDIAVPLEAVPTFNVAAGQNQSIWADIYIPKTTPTGTYTGSVTVKEGTRLSYSIPVELKVRNFTLPDVPTSKTMLYFGYGDINTRYTGTAYPNVGTAQDTLSKTVRNRHFLVAHRHKISLIDQNDGSAPWSTDAPRTDWVPRLNGSLFTAANGYNGPGVSTGNGIYSIGTYGSWSWKSGVTQATMQTHADNWVTWFTANLPGVEYFLYLIDESTNWAQTQQWASWVKSSPGVGQNLPTFATGDFVQLRTNAPAVDYTASWFAVAPTATYQSAADTARGSPTKRTYMYNGKRPATGSFATEDDGVALRELAWGQYKKGIDRWFFWESTYYNDYQGGRGQTNVFQTAATFSGTMSINSTNGEAGWNHSNGDGLLFYPGTDTVFPAESYGLAGPIASLRMKHWRRGIQDVDYIAQAMAIKPVQTQTIINSMVTKALWENGVADPADPTWQRCDIGWSTNPDDWESARSQLADIIEGL